MLNNRFSLLPTLLGWAFLIFASPVWANFNFFKDDFLPPEQAFAFSSIQENNKLILNWQIADGYYLYRDKFSLSANDQALQFKLPPAISEDDPYFGNVDVYYNQVELSFDLSQLDSSQREVQVNYQGCAKDGLCYLLQNNTVALKPLSSLNQQTPQDTEPSLNSPKAAPTANSSVDLQSASSLLNALQNSSFLLVMLVFFGAGILSAFAGCAYPMLPILSNIIIGEGEDISRGRAFAISMFYVLPMALVYSLFGVLAGVMGQSLTIYLQTPWAIGATSLLLVAMALSMFGLYNLQIPAFIQTRLNQISSRQQSGTYIGAFIMGIVSAFIVSACTVPPIVAGVSYIAQTGQVFQGAVAMFLFGLGLGLPLLILGMSAAWLLPKAGAWMNNIQIVMGIFLLWAAIFILSRIIFEPFISWIWLLFWLGLALYLLIGNKHFIFRLIAIVAAINVGILYAGSSATQMQKIEFTQVANSEQLSAHIAQLKHSEQAVIALNFTADWCSICQSMKHKVFPELGTEFANFKLLEVDLTKPDAAKRAIMQQYGVYGPPAMVFLTLNHATLDTAPTALHLEQFNAIGGQSKTRLKQLLQRVIDHQHQGR